MKTLHRKLLRDLRALGGQVAAIAVVIAAGVMTLIIAVTSLDAITLSQERFYAERHFADVFADLTRAPESVVERLRDLSGVNRVESRVVAPARLEVPGFADPVRGHIHSLPDSGEQPQLNQLHLRSGRLPEPGRGDEVVVGEPFAEAHELSAGDELIAIIRGRREVLTITGVVLSPEYVYQIGPADLLPDYERYGVFWMNRRALATVFDMDGAFNNVVLTVQPGVETAGVIDAVDEVLARHGGRGAHDRTEQISHRFLSEELAQLRTMAVVLPAIFLGVAAFLLNVLMGRIIRNQRQEIAALKAFGYGNREIADYYARFTGAIVLLGGAVGAGLGAWAAGGLAAVYMEYFRFPFMDFRLRPGVVLAGVGIAGTAAAAGTWRAVRGAVRLAPAEAMRPPAPQTFRRGWLERLPLVRRLDQGSRIILRNLARHRLKASLSILGIGLSAALLLVGSFQFGAVDRMVETQYRDVMRMDIELHFIEPTRTGVLAELDHYPGVLHTEGYRRVPVRLYHGHREERTTILGMEPDARLRGLRDAGTGIVSPPGEGLLLTDYLAEQLGLKVGDRVRVEVLERDRPRRETTLVGVVDEPLGMGAYMERRALNRLLGEGPALSGAWLLVDPASEAQLFEHLWRAPGIAGIGQIGQSEGAIRSYLDDTILVFMGILLLLAGSIAFAVVYNNARIAFAERARELATLRVLGFTRGEVAWILIGEVALISLLAIPVGWLVGTGLAWGLNRSLSMDLFRLPFIITPATYAFAAIGVILASVLSLALIARRLYRLEMITALRTVE